MGKYKRCPGCNRRNETRALECPDCETDLTAVGITDDESEQEQKMEDPEYIRLCGCGCVNLVGAGQCAACGEMIGDIVPTIKGQSENLKFVLADLGGSLEYDLPEGDLIIGREYALCEYLADKTYVSRRHAIVCREQGQVWIENLSNTNATFVNNIRISRRTLLGEGDEIGLGGNERDGARQQQAAYFILRRSLCT